MARMFGTDGVRGIVNHELTCTLAYRIACASADVMASLRGGTVVIGRDTRASGAMLEAAMTAGFAEHGVHVVSAGVVPTPAIAYLVPLTGAGAGVMITASHNGAEYNGVKLFGADGCKLPDDTEDAIETHVLSEKQGEKAAYDRIGAVGHDQHLIDRYRSYLLSAVPCRFRPLRIVIDCANGSASVIAPSIFASLGMKVHAISAAPDGLNINLSCGSTDTSSLRAEVVSAGADAGFAFDGDGDRLIAVDEHGREVDGDEIICMCALYMKKARRLRGDAVAGTVMSNMGLEMSLNRQGIALHRAAVGDRYVMESIVEHGLSLGGESSGHIIFADCARTGDGILTALHVMRVMSETGLPLSRLAAQMDRIPQYTCSANVPKERQSACLSDAAVAKEIAAVAETYRGQGRVLVRPSGTEPVIRVMTEHSDREKACHDAQCLKAMLEEAAGKNETT